MPDTPDPTPDDAGRATPTPGTPDGGVVVHPVLRPVDVDGVGAVLYGTVAWTVALVVCLLLRDRLAADGHTWWTWVCLAGALLGLLGLWFVRRRRDAYSAKVG